MLNKILMSTAIAVSMLSTVNAGFRYQSEAGHLNGGNHNAGQVTDIQAAYDDTSQMLWWRYTIQKNGSHALSDGFWLAVNNGPNPKGHAGELAIFYGDIIGGKLTAYEYNGQNKSNSWAHEAFLGSFTSLTYADNSTGTERTVTFGIDVTAINAYSSDSAWTGAAFDDKIGYWFHPLRGAGFTYNSDGTLKTFTQGSQGWYDKANLNTESWGGGDPFTAVPEPGSIFIFGAALLGGVVFRRKQRKA